MGGAVNSLEGRVALQRDPDKLEDWALTECMRFNNDKCWILCLGWGNPGCVYTLGNQRLESSAAERDLRVAVNDKLSCHCALAARRAASGTATSTSQRRGLSRSVLHWCGLTLSRVFSFGHHDIEKALSYY